MVLRAVMVAHSKTEQHDADVSGGMHAKHAWKPELV